MDDVYYYGWVLDADDVCVRVGSGGFTLLFGMFCVGCWQGFFDLLLMLLLPLRNGFFDAPVWFDATLHGYETWLLGIYRRLFSLLFSSSLHHFFCMGNGAGVR